MMGISIILIPTLVVACGATTSSTVSTQVEQINSVVKTLESGNVTITSESPGTNTLAQDVTQNNINTLISGLQNIELPQGAEISYTLIANSANSTVGSISANININYNNQNYSVDKPVTILGFMNNTIALQNIANNAIETVKILQASAAVNTLPSKITSTNLAQWFSSPANTATETFTLSITKENSSLPNPDNFTGNINLQLSVTSTLYPKNTAQANKNFDNFLSYQQQVNEVATAVVVTSNSSANTIYPIQINKSNISKFININSLPTNSHLSYIYTVSNIVKGTSTGTLELSVSVQNSKVNTTSISKNFNLTGFKIGTVSNEATVEEPSTSSDTTSLSNLISNLSVVVPENYLISQFIVAASNNQAGNWMPTNGLIGNVLFLNNNNNVWNNSNNWTTWTTQNTFSSLNPTTLNNINQSTINFRIYAKNGGGDNGSLKITVNGFTSPNEYLTPILDGITTLNANSTGVNTLPSTISDTNINNLINFPEISSGSGYTLQAKIVPNTANDITGSLNVILEALSDGVIVQKSASIIITNFAIAQILNKTKNIADNLGSLMPTNIALSNFVNNQPINFNLSNIPEAFAISSQNMTTLDNLVGSTNKDSIQITIALPTYVSGSGILTSNTSSTMTVTINGISATAVLSNFQSAQNYFATSKIITATLSNPSQYNSLINLWNTIKSHGLTGTNETINNDGSTNNSVGVKNANNQSVFNINLITPNIFNWTQLSLSYITCAIVGQTITLRIFIQSNVWYDVNFTASDIGDAASS